jgi:protein involved in polysaccharide export with SLBB domain
MIRHFFLPLAALFFLIVFAGGCSSTQVQNPPQNPGTAVEAKPGDSDSDLDAWRSQHPEIAAETKPLNSDGDFDAQHSRQPEIAAETKLLEEQSQKIIAQINAATGAVAVASADLIQPGDEISMQVWLRDRRTQFAGFPLHQTVPDSGRIFVPQLGLTDVAGKTDGQLQTILSAQFNRILQEAVVIVEHSGGNRPKTSVVAQAFTAAKTSDTRKVPHVTIMGWVGAPNIYELEPGWTLRDAVARAGGLKEFANKSKVFLVRGSIQKPQVILVNLQKILTGKELAQNVLLLPNDAIYVPPVKMWVTYDIIRTILLPLTAVRDSVWFTPSL